MVTHKRSKRKHPESKLMIYIIFFTVLFCLLYLSAKLMILKLAKLVEEQNVEANIKNIPNIDDIGAGMLCNKLSFCMTLLYESLYS